MKQMALKIACVLLVGLVLAGCSNTFNGMGRDIEHAGQSVQRTF